MSSITDINAIVKLVNSDGSVSYMPKAVSKSIIWQNNDKSACIVKFDEEKYRLLDAVNGKWLFDGVFNKIIFSNCEWCFAVARTEEGSVFLDKDMKIIECVYDDIRKEKNGFVVVKDNRYSVISFNSGEQSKWYDFIGKFVLDGGNKAFMMKNYLWGVIDSSGEVLYDCMFEGGKKLTPWMGFAIKKEDSWAVFSYECKWVTDFSYSDIEYDIATDTVLLSKIDMCELVFRNFTTIKAPYKQMCICSNSFIRTEDKNGKIGILDLNGNCVMEPQFDSLEYDSYRKIALVEKDGMFGIVNINGSWLFKPQFKKISDFGSSRILMFENTLGKLGFIGVDGTFLTDETFDEATPFNNLQYACVGRRKKCGVFRKKRMLYAYLSQSGRLATDFCFLLPEAYCDELSKNYNLKKEECYIKDYIKE